MDNFIIPKGLLKIIAYMLPYALIPLTFKFAGGMFASLSGMVNDKSKGLFDRQKQSRANKLERTKQGNLFKNAPENSLRSRLNTAGAGTMNIRKAGLRPSRMRSNLSNAMEANDASEIERNLKENQDYQTWKGNDDLNRDASDSRDANHLRTILQQGGRYANADGTIRHAEIDRDVARVESVRKSMSGNAFRRMTTAQALAGGTAYNRDGDSTGTVWAAVARAGGNDAAATATLVSQGRSALMAAGRIDQGGAGFGVTLGEVTRMQQELRETGDISDASMDQATGTIHANVLESQGADSLTHASMKPQAIRNLVPQFQQRLEAAANQSPEAYERELAIFAGVYDGMARSSPQNARTLAEGVMRWSPGSNAAQQPLAPGVAGPVLPANRPSVQAEIERLRGSDLFQTTRREYASDRDGRGGRPTDPNAPPGASPGAPG